MCSAVSYATIIYIAIARAVFQLSYSVAGILTVSIDFLYFCNEVVSIFCTQQHKKGSVDLICCGHIAS